MNGPIEKPSSKELTGPILEFLRCGTPSVWFDKALEEIDSLLIDHANCEKKAAATAMNLMYRHTAMPNLLTKMSQLAREELLHFQQVVEIMAERGIRYRRLGPSRYAAGLRKHIGKEEGQALQDTLIIGAIIEARSCERFAGLVPRLEAKGENQIARFYRSLLKSEARHFEDYLELARTSKAGNNNNCDSRIEEFVAFENELVSTADRNFRFHSGVPV